MSESVQNSAVKVNNYRRLMQMHETTPEFARSNAVGLDLHVQRRLFETTPTASRRKKRVFDEMMTSHRHEDMMDQHYTPKTTRADKEVIYLPSRDEICAAKRIDSALCSSKLVFGVPDENDEEDLQNFCELFEGEITAGSVIEVETSEVLSSVKDPPAWRVHQITDYFSTYKMEINTKLENIGSVRIPKAEAKPQGLPTEPNQTNELFTWKTIFGEHCNKHSAEAYRIFCTFKVSYPVLPKPEKLAIYMSKMGMDEKDVLTVDDIENCILKWTIDNLPNSTQNRSYHEAIQWLASQLKAAALNVPVLNNNLLNYDPMDVIGIMDAIEAHYQKLDDFAKWCISKSFKDLEIQDKQTLREFKDLLTRAIIALKRQGIEVSEEDSKAIYLYSGFKVYGIDGFQGISRSWPKNEDISYIDCTDQYEFLLQSHHVDEDLSKKFQETSMHKKQKLTHSVEGLTKMANNVISYENNTTKATETTANFSTKMCDHPECNKLKTASHTSTKCWRKHPDLCPEHLRDKFGKRKNNYLKGHRKSKDGQENGNNNNGDKRTPKAYLKNA